MTSANLTARYRPQTFAAVAGQESIKAILSRAALEDKVAPAYLFSGTRGVGKTTIARIFAKAVNCETAPTAEPCNQCSHCRQITAGSAVDVVEIDGASNRGIDDARRLKEDIGYAPIECRYKVFIIDEAHMLTREAFNALLKTLEEPPRHTTFIMATTEPHKFPATIISRCQHYVFKRLTRQGLVSHLEDVLGREGTAYEMGAVNLIAKRGAGSVRDSMSLLGQVLALGGASLTEADARQVLGLAGQDVFLSLVQSVRDQDLDSLCGLIRDILDQGLDIGFFLRELAACWRNLFLIKESKSLSPDLLDMTEDEAGAWKDLSGSLDLSHIHASWQMTLESRQRVLKSMEPALALELLLLNLAYLPRLLSLDQLGRAGGPPPARPGQGSGPGPGPGPGFGPGRAPGSPPPPRPPQGPAGPNRFAPPAPDQRPAPPVQAPSGPDRAAPGRPPLESAPGPEGPSAGSGGFFGTTGQPVAPAPAGPASGPDPEPRPEASPASPSAVARSFSAPDAAPAPDHAAPAAGTPAAPGPRPASGPAPNFEDFAAYLNRKLVSGECSVSLHGATGQFEGDTLVVSCSNGFHAERMDRPTLARMLKEMTGRDFAVEVRQRPGAVTKTHGELAREAAAHPLIQQLVQEFQAHLHDVEPLRNGSNGL